MERKKEHISKLIDHSKDLLVKELSDPKHPFRRARRELPIEKLSERSGLPEDIVEHLLFRDPARTGRQIKAVEELLDAHNELDKLDNLTLIGIRDALQRNSELEELGSWSKTKREIVKRVAENRGFKNIPRMMEKLEKREKNMGEREDFVKIGFGLIGLTEESMEKMKKVKLGSKELMKLNTRIMREINSNSFEPPLDRIKTDDIKTRMMEVLKEIRESRES